MGNYFDGPHFSQQCPCPTLTLAASYVRNRHWESGATLLLLVQSNFILWLACLISISYRDLLNLARCWVQNLKAIDFKSLMRKFNRKSGANVEIRMNLFVCSKMYITVVRFSKKIAAIQFIFYIPLKKGSQNL